jgi:hypothetical protein
LWFGDEARKEVTGSEAMADEPTLEELMAELDAGLDSGAAPDAVSGDPEADTSEFEAELGLLAQGAEASAAYAHTFTHETAPATRAPAAALAARTPAAAHAAAHTAAQPAPSAAATRADGEQRGSSAEGGAPSSAIYSWWASVKASAEGLISADGIAIDTAGISTDYQRGKEVSREYASKLSSLFSMASQEVLATAADVVASARTMNSKILLKPQASFGVPLELIMKREQGYEDVASVPLVLEGLLSILEQRVKTNGGAALPVRLLAAKPDEDEFSKLEGFRDALDVGETIEALELSGESSATIAGLVKLFLLELPQPLLTHECYQEFLNALLYEGGVTSATDVVGINSEKSHLW